MKRVLARNVRGLTAAAGGARTRIAAGKYGEIVGRLCQSPAREIGVSQKRPTNLPTMNSDKAIELEGTITSVLPGTMFRVALANEHLVLAHISGKMRKRFIRLTVGDRVRMQMSPYDTAKARIVYRL